jgi:hypothetical protein
MILKDILDNIETVDNIDAVEDKEDIPVWDISFDIKVSGSTLYCELTHGFVKDVMMIFKDDSYHDRIFITPEDPNYKEYFSFIKSIIEKKEEEENIDSIKKDAYLGFKSTRESRYIKSFDQFI